MELEKLKEEIEKAKAAETNAEESWQAIYKALTRSLVFANGNRITFSLHATDGTGAIKIEEAYPNTTPNAAEPPIPSEELILPPEVMSTIFALITVLENKAPGFLQGVLPAPIPGGQ